MSPPPVRSSSMAWSSTALPTESSTVITITPTAKPSSRKSVRYGRKRSPLVMSVAVFTRAPLPFNDAVAELSGVRIMRRHDDGEARPSAAP